MSSREQTDHRRPDTVAIVPAGGQSRRLAGLVGPGGKAAIEVAGEPLLGRICRALAAEVGRVIVVTAAGRPLPPLPKGVELVFDRQPGRGPLAAIHDGLVHAVTSGGPPPRRAVLVACDLPRLEAAVVQRLLDHRPPAGSRWMVPVVDGEPQVLCSVLSVDLLPFVEATLATGRLSLRSLLAAVAESDPHAVALVPVQELLGPAADFAAFADLDTPDDLAGC